MPAVIRAYGEHFDVDGYLAHCTLPVCSVKRRGEPLFPASQPDGRRHPESGVHVLVSGADFNEFAVQVQEAITFFRTNGEELRRLSAFPGIDTPCLDFGIERRDVAIQCDRLPSELLRLVGNLGFDIELSQYPAADRNGFAEDP